jgi:hypothetical protein
MDLRTLGLKFVISNSYACQISYGLFNIFGDNSAIHQSLILTPKSTFFNFCDIC